ncbi:helix-turn-helix transcriptional regulator [Arabiibacter massiliensis]|uniref:helix-turn-helix transcriptional regulator n=1 Tax=Arabiibacter massiliensis TaxID=1870985 RepID=UPI0009B9F303|nr:helix-turn-helix transcriptional regulator [Arabiibacter massiliensis]
MDAKRNKEDVGGRSVAGMDIAAMAVGFCAWYTCSNWVSALTYGFAFDHWWLNRSGAIIAATLVLCPLLWRFGMPRSARVLDWAAAALYAGAMFALSALREGAAPVAAVVAALAAFAVAQTWMVARWSGRYASATTSDVAKALIAAIALVAVLKAVTTLLPEAATMTLMLLLPFLSAGMLVFHHDEDARRSDDVWFSSRSFAPFARIVAAMAVFFFLWSILNMALKHGTGHYSFGSAATPLYTLASQAIVLVFCLVVYAWVFVRRGRLDLTTVWKFAYVLMAVSLFMLVVLGMAQFIQAFTGAAVVIAKMFLWLALANVARHSAFKPFMVFCLGVLVYSVPDWLGRCTASFLALDSLDPVVSTAVLVLIVIMVTFFLPVRSPDVQHLLADLNGTPAAGGQAGDLLDARCAVLGRAHGLSKREVEILQYLCKGRSRPYIAETLYLSENTVRTHSKNIYVKLGVHNRQELLDLASEG